MQKELFILRVKERIQTVLGFLLVAVSLAVIILIVALSRFAGRGGCLTGLQAK